MGAAVSSPKEPYDLLEGVEDEPVRTTDSLLNLRHTNTNLVTVDCILVPRDEQRGSWYAHVPEGPALALHPSHELEGANTSSTSQWPSKQEQGG